MATKRFLAAVAACCTLVAISSADDFGDYYRSDARLGLGSTSSSDSVDEGRLESFGSVRDSNDSSGGLLDSAYGDFDAEGSTCENCCQSCDDCCCAGKKPRLLFGLVAPSDHAFDDFISPITNPVFFEDPRTLTELRFIFLNQVIPESQPLLQGGDWQVWAMQFRAALTERLSIIAAKDGYINLHTDALGDFDGWADIYAGLKYNLIRDPEAQTLVSAGIAYEIDLGDHQVFQGQGDGEFNFFLTGGTEILGCGHWLSATGFRVPSDHNTRSQMWYWSNHWDYEFFEGIYGLIELNWFHWIRSGGSPARRQLRGRRSSQPGLRRRDQQRHRTTGRRRQMETQRWPVIRSRLGNSADQPPRSFPRPRDRGRHSEILVCERCVPS